MRVFRSCVAIVLFGFGFSAFACEIPSIPDLPLGKDLSERTKRRLDEAVIEYTGSMAAYVNCVQAEHSAAQSAGAPNIVLSLIATRNNSAIEELKAVHDAYTAQVGPVEVLFQGLQGAPN